MKSKRFCVSGTAKEGDRADSAFLGRLTPELAEVMRQLAERAFVRLQRGKGRLQMALRAFQRVFIADGSLIRLGDALQEDYPSVWTNHMKASAKMHLVIDALKRTPVITRIVCQGARTTFVP